MVLGARVFELGVVSSVWVTGLGVVSRTTMFKVKMLSDVWSMGGVSTRVS